LEDIKKEERAGEKPKRKDCGKKDENGVLIK
jgi:hypothetical protein